MLVIVGMGTRVGVGVTVGETVGVGLRVGVLVGVEVAIAAITGGVSVGVKVGVSVSVGIGVGVAVGRDVHQGAVNEKPSNIQVRPFPPLQVVWKTFIWRPARKSVPCPRSAGGGEKLLAVPIGMETTKLFGL